MKIAFASARTAAGVAVAMSLALLLFAATADAKPARADLKPKVATAKKAKVGKLVRLKGRGFPARAPLSITLQPTVNRGGNGFGRLVRTKMKVQRNGRFTLRFRFPRTYAACAGINACTSYRWARRGRVDINICAQPAGAAPVCARRVVRLG